MNGEAASCDEAPAPATAPTDNAAAPTRDASDVISIYGGTYTSIATNLNPGWGQIGTVDPNYDPGTGDLVLQYANFNYQGTDVAATDASAMTHLHVDVWVAEGTDRQLKVSPINPGDGLIETLVSVPLTPGSWNSVDLAKADFTGMTWTNIIQMKFDGQFNGDGSANPAGWDVYLDNIYFYNDGSGDTGGGDGDGTDPVAATPTDNAPDPTADAANVISIYGEAYTSIATNFDPNWGQSGHTVVNPNFDPGTGNLVLAYPNFNYQGTQLAATNLSEMGYLHVDVWVEAGTDRLLKVTPVNDGDGGTGAGEFLVNVPLTPGAWSSVDLPRSAFTGMTWDNVFQMKFDGQFNGDGSANGAPYDVYLDNIYFWKDPAAAIAGCTDPDANNYNSAATEDDSTCSYDVTFQVDMSQYGLADGDVVYTNGTYNNWCGGCNPMTDDDADGIWTGTFTLPGGSQEYKFTINGWDISEQFDGSEACTTDPAEYVNRVTTIDGSTTLPVVCWNSCDACPACTDQDADGVCDSDEIVGCQDDLACNYDPLATDAGECNFYDVTGTMFNLAQPYWLGPATGAPNVLSVCPGPIQPLYSFPFTFVPSAGGWLEFSVDSLTQLAVIAAGYQAAYDDTQLWEAAMCISGTDTAITVRHWETADDYHFHEFPWTSGSSAFHVPDGGYGDGFIAPTSTLGVGCNDPGACNFSPCTAPNPTLCTYPAHANFDCDGNCNNDADGDGICDELEGLIPDAESHCGIGTMWDAELGQCVFNVECAGDVNLDGAITSGDLLQMLANFGTWCPGYGPDAE